MTLEDINNVLGEDYDINSKYYNLIFKNNNSNYSMFKIIINGYIGNTEYDGYEIANNPYIFYWLASKYSEKESNDSNIINYGLYAVNSGNVTKVKLLDSSGKEYGGSYYLRPVVHLESDIQLRKDGSSEVWEIYKDN